MHVAVGNSKICEGHLLLKRIVAVIKGQSIQNYMHVVFLILIEINTKYFCQNRSYFIRANMCFSYTFSAMKLKN